MAAGSNETSRAARNGPASQTPPTPIEVAIVGLSCRFPGGSNSPEQFWDNLEAGKSGVREMRHDRWDQDSFYHPNPSTLGKYYSKRAGMLDNVTDFDAAFFGISPREAEQMDPQQRLLLELAWESFERAGILPSRLAGTNCAVYVGISATDYGNIRSNDAAGINAYTMLGSTLSVAANRLSHFFDLRGASLAIDTACSSALVAVHEAVHSIHEGRADLALVGGVHMLLSPDPFIGFSRATLLSPEGECRAFGKSANGYVRAEGGGMLLLKPLAQAIADRDPIVAVIRGSGINNDGRTMGVALPSSKQQEALLRSIYDRRGLHLEDLVYVEAHGTGTAAGDPAEAQAIGRALGRRFKKAGALPIGSVKSNIGHLEPASGIAGVIKAIGVLQRKTIPASLHAEQLNPEIPFEKLNIRVVRASEPVRRTAGPALVGVSSFGFGGTNAHLVLAEHRSENATVTEVECEGGILLPLSARTEASLGKLASEMAAVMEDSTVSPLDIAYSAAMHRTHHDRRILVRAESRAETAEALRRFATGEHDTRVIHGASLSPQPKVAFVFAGNGAQGTEEGLRSMLEDPLFDFEARRVDGLVRETRGWSVLEQIALPDKRRTVPSSGLVQLLSFGIQASLVNALAAGGLRPEAVTGHSFGEIPAAWAAGALAFEQAVRLILDRVEVQESSRGRGRMAAASIDATRAAAEISRYNGSIEIAAVNSPCAVTFTGDEASLVSLGRSVSDSGATYRLLDLDYAFHSRHLEGGRNRLLETLNGMKPARGNYPFYSTVSGSKVAGDSLDADYWWRNMRQCVRFDKAMSALIEDGYAIFIEIGAHPIMQAYIRHSLRAANAPGQPLCVITRQASHGADRRVSDTVARAYTLGADLDWTALFPKGRQFVSLPTYPWDRHKHWYSTTEEAKGAYYHRSEGPLLGSRFTGDVDAWETLVDTAIHPFLADHVVGNGVVFPASGFLEIVLEAAAASLGDGPKEVELLQIHHPMTLESGKSRRQSVTLSEDGCLIAVKSKPRLSEDGWTLHATARIATADQSRVQPLKPLAEVPGTPVTVSASEHYRAAESIGLSYGPAFRLLQSTRVNGCFAEAMLGNTIDSGRFEFHPGLVDCGLQALLDVAQRQSGASLSCAFIPVQIERTLVFKTKETIRLCRAFLARISPRSLVADFDMLDETGQLVASLRGCRFVRAELRNAGAKAPRYYQTQPVALEMEGASPTMPSSAALATSIRASAAHPFSLNSLVTLISRSGSTADNWTKALHAHPGFVTELLLAGAERLQQDELEHPHARERLKMLLDSSGTSRAFDDAIEHALRSIARESLRARKIRLLEIGPDDQDRPIEFDSTRFTHLKSMPSGIEIDLPLPLNNTNIVSKREFDVIVLRHPVLCGPSLPNLLEHSFRLLVPGGRLVLVSHEPGPWTDLVLNQTQFPSLLEWKPLLEKADFVNPEVVPVAAGFIVIAERSQSASGISADPRSNLPSTKWLIVVGTSPAEDSLAHDLAILLVESGHTAYFFRNSKDFLVDDLEICFPFNDPAGWTNALEKIADEQPMGIIYLNGLSEKNADSSSIEAQTWPVACLAKSLAPTEILRLPSVILVTAGAQPLPSEMMLPGATEAPCQASLWGLARVWRNEYPQLKCRTIDLHCRHDQIGEMGAVLASEVLSADAPSEDEVIRGLDRRLGQRLRSIDNPTTQEAPSGGLRLDPSANGLAGLRWLPRARQTTGRGELEIEVKAIGLNFRDVMYSMGVLPEEALENGFAGATLGMEGAGVVSAVGSGSRRFSVGDKVFFFGPACFATHVVTSSKAVALIPPHLDFISAATIPAAFFTVIYSLFHLAKLRRGERILIHGAAGGVGLAAIQYARHVGAEIFATVGLPEKRDLLKLLGVAENRIFDSRSLSFSDNVLRATGNEGVDVIINSIAGKAIEKGLATLRPFGRFVELGKRDFFANTRMGIRPFRNNLSYFGVDADQLLASQPRVANRIFREVTSLFSKGAFHPLPYHVYKAQEVVHTFRQMQQGRHLGKIVITPPLLPPAQTKKPEAPRSLDSKATYMILGGSSGFGMASVETLVNLGARHLYLVGLKRIASEGLREIISNCEARGVEIERRSCDISIPGALRDLIREIRESGHPLHGIIHAATVYEDGGIASMTFEQFRKVVAVKAGVALELHSLLAEEQIDFVAMYSSVAATLGNPGQANYVAANAVLDALARSDSSRKGRFISLAWGAIGDVGYLARRDKLNTAFQDRLGVKVQISKDALTDLALFLGASAQRLPNGQVTIGEVDWSAAALRMSCGIERHSRFKELAVKSLPKSVEGGGIRSLISGLSRAEVQAFTREMLIGQIGAVLRLAPDKLDLHRPITELGMDSLTAVELRILIEKKFDYQLPAMMISEGASIARLVERITDVLLNCTPSTDSDNDRLLADLYAKHGESPQTLGNGNAMASKNSLRFS